jgi:hypothetical protein
LNSSLLRSYYDREECERSEALRQKERADAMAVKLRELGIEVD